MSKRADDVQETRRRIVEAAVRLHGTIGPAATTISALAEEAGVTRLTVYRHFPDDLALFTACSAHWASTQTFPDPTAWRTVQDPEQRLRVALADLYRFYREGQQMLTRVRRDRAALPPEVQQNTATVEAGYRAELLRPFGSRGRHRKRLEAVLGHAISFWTWHSLCLDNGLSDDEAVDAMTNLALTTASA